MSSQFQPYFESICAAYEKWWQLYTLTDAAGKERQAKQAALTFDFGLMVQTVKKEERREEEKSERFPVLEGIRKYAEQHVLLVGRPGSGKSTALARLLLEEATIAPSRIPVLVELRYWQGSIEQLIRDSFTRHEMPAESVEAALKQALILFDGVNELPSEEARSQLSAFRRNHPKLPMIFTTRDLSIGGDLGIEQKLEMQPLTEAQMQTFIRAYVPEQAEAMLRQLKDRLREFGQAPLLLWMLCGVFQQTGTIPENLGLVFREFTQGYERYLKDDVRIESDRSWWKPVLQQLAWVMMQGEKPTEFRVAIREEEAVRAIAQSLNDKGTDIEEAVRTCLRDLQKHHLIQAGANQEKLEFRYPHIREYYAAEALLEKLPQLDDEQLKREYLNFLKWTEAIEVMLMFVEQEQAVQVVKLALEVDYSLGARLAGAVKPEFQEKTLELVDTLAVPDWLKIELLEKTRSRSAISFLLRLTEHTDPEISLRAIEALDTLGSNRALSIYLRVTERPVFDDHRGSAASHASKTLRKLMNSDTAIAALLELIEDADADMQRRAVLMLRFIESEIAIPTLLKLTEDPDGDRRSIAAMTLGQIGSEVAVPTLLKLTEDLDYNVRCSAASALGHFPSERVVSTLLKLAEQSRGRLQNDAVMALGYIKTDLAIPILLNLIEDPDISTVGMAILALGDIGSELAVPGLIKLAENLTQESSDRALAIRVLGWIGSQAAIPTLIQQTKDTDWEVKCNAAEALGKIRSDLAIPPLIKLVDDPDPLVLRDAVQALGQIKSGTAISALCNLTHHADAKVRWRVADELGKHQSDAVVSALIELRQDSDDKVREKAAEMLGKIGADIAIPILLDLLEDSSQLVRQSATEALGKIGSDKVIPTLLKRVEAGDRDAAMALGNIESAIAISRLHTLLLLTLLETSTFADCAAAIALGTIAVNYPALIAQHLPAILTLIPIDSGKDAHSVIRAIQENCKYYNYETYQAHLEAQKHDRQTPQNNDRSPTINQFPNATEVKIIENVDRYYEAPSKEPPS